MVPSSLGKRHAANPRRWRFALSQPLPDPDTQPRLVAIAVEAGRIAFDYFRLGGRTRAGVEWKGDGTPVTEADVAVNLFLERELKALRPDAAWLSEESIDSDGRLDAEAVFIVDPIDGTRGFSEGDPHWAVAIALVEAGRPVAGVVHAPALGETYAASAGRGATLNGASLPLRQERTLRPDMKISCPKVLAKALTDAGVDFAYQPKIASLALRIAKVASGVYDAGFTSRNSHDWDLAAADLVLSEAGGILADLGGERILYNKKDPVHGVLTAAPGSLQGALRASLARTKFGRVA